MAREADAPSWHLPRSPAAPQRHWEGGTPTGAPAGSSPPPSEGTCRIGTSLPRKRPRGCSCCAKGVCALCAHARLACMPEKQDANQPDAPATPTHSCAPTALMSQASFSAMSRSISDTPRMDAMQVPFLMAGKA